MHASYSPYRARQTLCTLATPQAHQTLYAAAARQPPHTLGALDTIVAVEPLFAREPFQALGGAGAVDACDYAMHAG